MFKCSIRTEEFKFTPVWDGCQGEPERYSCAPLPTEIEDGLLPEQITDRVLSAFLNIIIRENPDFESLRIETEIKNNNWPDSYGGTIKNKKLTCEKNVNNNTETLDEKVINLGDSVDRVHNNASLVCYKTVTEKFLEFEGNGYIDTLKIRMFTRKNTVV